MMQKKQLKIATLLFVLVLFSSCNSRKTFEDVGLLKSSPDEFLVTTRPDLKVPKDFSLPSPQKQSTQSASEDGRNLLRKDANKKTTSTKALTKSEEKLLEKASEKPLKKVEKKEYEKNKTTYLEKIEEDAHEEIESKKINHESPPKRIKKDDNSKSTKVKSVKQV
jgi:hypothetical protein